MAWEFLNYVVEDLTVLNLTIQGDMFGENGKFNGTVICNELQVTNNITAGDTITAKHIIATESLTVPSLDLTGDLTANNITANNNLKGKNLEITQNATIAGNLTVNDITCRNITASGNVVLTNGDLTVSTGKITATGGFVGSLSGNATTATTLQNSRTFTITGDTTASGQSFNGSSNVTFNTTVEKVRGVNVTNSGGTLIFASNLQGTRVFNAVYNDYAECFEVEENKGYDYYKYRIVEIDNNGKVKLSSNKSSKVIGVVSSSYAFLLNGTDEDVFSGNKVPVGMSGTVLVESVNKVDRNNIGCMIYSGDEGKAIVADTFTNDLNGKIVGKIIDIDENNNFYKIIIMLK